MNILLTNDDGIYAKGINILAKKILEKGHKLTISAPHEENSGKSHAITFKSPLMVEKIKLEGLEDVDALKVYGTPADCVRAAVELSSEKFDFCFSGCNSGYNAATNVLYSGTVSAAIEANLYKISSMAVSAQWKGDSNYESASRVAMELFEKIKDEEQIVVYNLNIPYLNYEELKGLKVCEVGAEVMSIYEITEEEDKINMQLKGFPKENNKDQKSDFYYLNEGYATLSPLLYDVTNKVLIEKLQNKLEK